MRILFIIKKRSFYTDEDCYSDVPTSGLYNSSNFVNTMLIDSGIDSHIEEVQDGNSVDRIVHRLRPDIVFIEALWIAPAKMAELMNLHKRVNWIVRIHSNASFIANEGIAMEWCIKYLKMGITLAPNCMKMFRELKAITNKNIVYLPNYYQIQEREFKKTKNSTDTLELACLGAIRPLKNQLIQALAAIKLAGKLNMKLNFHINASRIENNGNSVLKNLRGLFDNLNDNFKLIEHRWHEHDHFLRLLRKMDVGMQVSFSESFNIVAADYVSQGVPIVVSKEIEWASIYSMAETTDIDDIVCKMERALENKLLPSWNMHNLKSWNHKTKKIWLEYVS